MARVPRGLTLTTRYVAFALFASAVNLATQALVLAVYQGPRALLLAMAAGTIAGLVPKFLLDKYLIFQDRTPGRLHGLRQFVLYGLLSVVTTLLFWGFELGFKWLDPAGSLHYAGAALGLGLGYWAKYHLDRRFVFRPA